MGEWQQLKPEEVAAMWLYGSDYARSGMSAVQWWEHLRNGAADTAYNASRARNVRDFVDEMRKAMRAEPPQ